MAPELFQSGAPHSSASDLWALGCVLYECAAGHPPFMSDSLTQLVHDILNNDPAPIPGGGIVILGYGACALGCALVLLGTFC